MSALLLSVCAFCNDSLTVFYRIRLDQDIDPSSQRLVTTGLEKAREARADYVILDLDTYGGAVNAADSIRSAILRFESLSWHLSICRLPLPEPLSALPVIRYI